MTRCKHEGLARSQFEWRSKQPGVIQVQLIEGFVDDEWYSTERST